MSRWFWKASGTEFTIKIVIYRSCLQYFVYICNAKGSKWAGDLCNQEIYVLSINFSAMNWYLKCFRQYADFEGRARRKEFWMYSLFNFAIYAVLMLIAATFYINGYPSMLMAVGGLASLYSLATLVSSLAVTFRRIHDTGRHGYMFSVGFIPIVGQIWLLMLLCQDSQSDSKK